MTRKPSIPIASDRANRLGIGFVFALGLALFASTARAQTGEAGQTAAEVLFEEGRRLMALGQYPEACAKFRESQRLDSGAGTLMNLGRCYAKLGKTASAWITYRQAAAFARAAGQEDRESIARREVAALELDLSKVRIVVSEEARALKPTVKLDGAELGAELWEVATPVDPGDHELTVSAPERQAWSRRFRVEPRQLETVRVPAPEATAVGTSSVRSEAPAPSGWKLQHTTAVIGAGLGVAALAAGAFLTVSAHDDYDTGRKSCVDEINCNSEGVRLRERAIMKGKLATISFVVGGAALAGGTVLWLTAPAITPKSGSDGRDSAWSVAVSGVW